MGAKGTTFAPFFASELDAPKMASSVFGCTPRLLMYLAVVTGLWCRKTACTEGRSRPLRARIVAVRWRIA